MPTPDSVKSLIDTFDRNLEFYKSDRYNEAQLRQEFLDPFFKAMGWDMDNTSGMAPQYRDVIHEASIRIGGFTKAPDYAFSIHGQWKFFLEAKKPSVNVKENADPAYQLRRYGWSAKLPVSILTDFEELAVYDCRPRPKKGESPSVARLEYIKYQDYAERWDDIYGTFSKEAILSGSFDKYTLDSKRHRGAETVDNAFLGEIERWRDILARNLALRNKALSVRDLNFSVQKIIDRIIFLRICEDRGTEDYKRLAALLNGERIYPRLLELFIQADARYNSGLFHFSSEKDRGAPDTITSSLTLDDKVLKDIIANLYYPESPYEFSVLPADILGQVYEQFLGKTIHLTAGHQARIEEKPEVRKAGGVYYTPGYIVDYIVKNTLGRLLDGDDPDKPKPIPVSKAADIKVLDPACGSGSFLIVAYQHLLDWHLRQYTADENGAPDEGKIKRHGGGKNPKIYQAPDGAWKLTADERKRILLNNIHGVDIDSQAVEVTKLSLLLKVIEGETHQISQRDWIHERQRILPDLENNIKCGNSLIGPDFYENEQMLLLDEETQYRINVFDWKRGFPEIMKRGGFDCVIGNPPYVVLDKIDFSKAYLERYYKTAQGKYDLYRFFIERAGTLARQPGYFSFIVPNSLLSIPSAQKLRHHMVHDLHLCDILNFWGMVFQGVSINSCVFICSLGNHKTAIRVRDDLSARPSESTIMASMGTEPLLLERSSYSGEDKIVTPRNDAGSLIDKIANVGVKLSDVADYELGIQVYHNSIHGKEEIQKRIHHSPNKRSDGDLREIGGRNIDRYFFAGKFKDWVQITERCYSTPSIWVLSGERLLIREITSNTLIATLATEDLAPSKALIAVKSRSRISNCYLLGILNSLLMGKYVNASTEKGSQRLFPRISLTSIRNLPIRPINFDDPGDKAKHDKMVALVERMLELNRKKAEEKNPDALRQLETQLAATDSQIDRLVYDLYNLTESEIAIIEKSAE